LVGQFLCGGVDFFCGGTLFPIKVKVAVNEKNVMAFQKIEKWLYSC
jgi:hypothetical protein